MLASLRPRWGHLTRLRVIQNPVLAKRLDGTNYETGERGQEEWELQCDCGFIWRINAFKFPGKRHLRSCQRAECAFSQPDKSEAKEPSKAIGRPRLQDLSRPVTVYMPIEMQREIHELVAAHPEEFRSFSYASVHFMETGLAAWKAAHEIPEERK